jgi:hypothetical protein
MLLSGNPGAVCNRIRKGDLIVYWIPAQRITGMTKSQDIVNDRVETEEVTVQGI